MLRSNFTGVPEDWIPSIAEQVLTEQPSPAGEPSTGGVLCAPLHLGTLLAGWVELLSTTAGAVQRDSQATRAHTPGVVWRMVVCRQAHQVFAPGRARRAAVGRCSPRSHPSVWAGRQLGAGELQGAGAGAAGSWRGRVKGAADVSHKALFVLGSGAAGTPPATWALAAATLQQPALWCRPVPCAVGRCVCPWILSMDWLAAACVPLSVCRFTAARLADMHALNELDTKAYSFFRWAAARGNRGRVWRWRRLHPAVPRLNNQQERLSGNVPAQQCKVLFYAVVAGGEGPLIPTSCSCCPTLFWAHCSARSCHSCTAPSQPCSSWAQPYATQKSQRLSDGTACWLQ